MKKILSQAEWYPVWELTNRPPLGAFAFKEVDISDKLAEEWTTIRRDFEKMQKRLGHYWGKDS